MLIPKAKEQNFLEGEFLFDTLIYKTDSEDGVFAQTYLNCYYPKVLGAGESPNLTFVKKAGLKVGGYCLSIQDKITIEYAEREGLRNALSTLIVSMQLQDNGFSLQKQYVKDEPECDYRSVLIDLARGLPNYERLKEDVKRLALAKCNYLHLHLMDTFGICYESNVFKMEEGIRGTTLYTKQQMKEFVAYCEMFGIEVVPEFEIPAHASYLVKSHPELVCKTELENPSMEVVCAGSENTYKFVEDMLDEYAEIFSSNYIHMGGDELYFDDLPEWNWKANWQHCKVCQKKMAEEGISGDQELYYYVVRRVNEIVSKRGKTLIMYNDQIDISKPVNLPRDIIIQFWRIAYKYRGPHVDCTYEKFLEAGFKVIASPYEYTYIDDEGGTNPERTSWFDFKDYKETRAMYEDSIVGGETCAWEYGNPEYTHYEFSFPSASILVLAKMWNSQPVAYNFTYRRVLTKLLLGIETPKGYDLFDLFGSIMPARNNTVKCYVDVGHALLGEPNIAKHAAALHSFKNTYSPIFLASVTRYVDNLEVR